MNVPVKVQCERDPGALNVKAGAAVAQHQPLKVQSLQQSHVFTPHSLAAATLFSPSLLMMS